MAHIHKPVPLPSAVDPDVDPRLEATLIKALAKEPDDRHQTPTELMKALSAVVADPEPGTGFYAQVTVEEPVVPYRETGELGEVHEEEKPDSAAGVVRDDVSPDQAGVLAIRHARENTDFYGRRYSKRELVWEVVGSEEGDDYYQVRLSYRPAGRFSGQPGIELFTIDKSGSIELRQLLEEPTESFRQLINESVQILGLRIPLVGLALLLVVGVVVGGLLFNLRGSEPPPVPPGTVRISVSPGEPAQLVSPRGDVTIDLAAGSVDTTVRLWYQPLAPAEIPPLPAGFLAADKLFDLSVDVDQGSAAGPFSFNQPITITARLSAGDAQMAGVVESNVVIQHYDDSAIRWVPLPTAVDFLSSIARAQVDRLSIFALTTRQPQPTATAMPSPAPAGVAEPASTAAPSRTPEPTAPPAEPTQGVIAPTPSGERDEPDTPTPVPPVSSEATGLVRAGTISGRVTDAATGHTIADVFIRAGQVDGDSWYEAETDSDGQYTLTGVAPGTYKLSVDAGRGYYKMLYDGQPNEDAANTLSVPAGAVVGEIDFALKIGGTISGRVTDAKTGLPMSGVTIEAHNVNGGYSSAMTDSDGQYLILGLAPGSHRLSAYVSPLGYVDEHYADDVTFLGQENATDLDFELTPRATISGKVKDASTGLGIPDMEVLARLVDTEEELGVTMTDSNGDYTLTGLRSGDILITVSGQGYVPISRTVSVAAGENVTGFDF